MQKSFRAKHVALAFALVAGPALHAEVDFQPIPKIQEVEGIRDKYVVFRDSGREISYYPPGGWRLTGSGPKLTLIPDAVANADGQFEVRTVVNPVAISQASIPQYTALAQQSVPRTAKNLVVLGSEINPLQICGYETLAVSLQYEAFNTTYQSKLIYLNRNREQWVFKCTAPEATFKQAFEPFRTSLFSLQGL
jgi:hypothetical protein